MIQFDTKQKMIYSQTTLNNTFLSTRNQFNSKVVKRLNHEIG